MAKEPAVDRPGARNVHCSNLRVTNWIDAADAAPCSWVSITYLGLVDGLLVRCPLHTTADPHSLQASLLVAVIVQSHPAQACHVRLRVQEAEVYLHDLSNGRHLQLSLSRSFFQEMCDDLFQKCMDEVDELLAEPGRSGDWPPPLKALLQDPDPI